MVSCPKGVIIPYVSSLSNPNDSGRLPKRGEKSLVKPEGNISDNRRGTVPVELEEAQLLTYFSPLLWAT